MSAQERVDAIRARLAAATPGPWYVERSPANCDLHGHVTIWLDGSTTTAAAATPKSGLR
ncbi:MAG: hypothetical protein HOQ21_01605 [Dermatophilaceae bacterium]|nr:hypothetical protein [Dermatophilaceae bacterium]